jgi:hypothetical protein
MTGFGVIGVHPHHPAYQVTDTVSGFRCAIKVLFHNGIVIGTVSFHHTNIYHTFVGLFGTITQLI